MPLILALLLTFLGCGPRIKLIPHPEPKPSPPAIALPGAITLICDSSCTEHERDKIAQAETIINRVRHQDCFKRIFVYAPFIDHNRNMTIQQIIDDLEGHEAVAAVNFYYKPGRVIGYRNVGESVIHMNRYFHDRPTYDNPWLAASNAFHEVSHLMGYDHDFSATRQRPYSVPYLVNRGVEACETAK